MIVCVPITSDGQVDPRWGRADWIAVANVVDGKIESWQEIEVSWSRLHDEGSPARHHARVARFLLEHHVEGVVAHHVGEGMVRMMSTMKLPLYLEATGDARAAVLASVGT
jgi:predicted Fe-Mo cluster-binding NifX family protein